MSSMLRIMSSKAMLWSCALLALARAAPGCVNTTGPAPPVAATADPRSGIVRPRPWPPRDVDFNTRIASDPPQAPRTPASPPYCRDTLSVRRIDGGRQLFVDNYLLDWRRTRNVTRTWGRLKIKDPKVLAPTGPMDASCHTKDCKPRKTARPFGGGSLYDPVRKRLLLWYRCGWRGVSYRGVPGGRTCVASSTDGLRFHRPRLPAAASAPAQKPHARGKRPKADRRVLRENQTPLRGGTNVVIATASVEAFEVAYDFLSTPPRFVALRMEYMTHGSRYREYEPYVSSDGLAWKIAPKGDRWRSPGVMADRSTFFLNPLREKPVWAFSLRENLCQGGPSGHMRARRLFEAPYAEAPLRRIKMKGDRPLYSAYYQCAPLLEGDEAVPWFAVDRQDCVFGQCDVYSVDGIAYESLLVHGLALLHGPANGGELKNNSAHLGFSRDGFSISRPEDRRPFVRDIPADWWNVQLASGSPIIAGHGSRDEKLYFYVGYGVGKGGGKSVYKDYEERTALATLRRDGFARLQSANGTVVTQPVAFARAPGPRFLWVNANVKGLPRVCVLSDSGAPICGFNDTITGPADATRRRLLRLDDLAERVVRFEFHLEDAALYAFWVAGPDGKSGGYLAGGALGHGSLVDE